MRLTDEERSGPRKTIASAQDERILNEKRRFRDIPFDLQPIHTADLSALSRVYFEQEYLVRAFAPDILAANERSYEQRLAACRMIASAADPVPTVMGMLTIGNAPRDWIPGAYLQFIRFAGLEPEAPILDEVSIDGPIAQLLRRVDEKIDSHNRTEVDFRSADLEQRKESYPRVALQQLIRNAVMHRTYENTHAPVRVHWFDDRLEIISPGGPYGTVTEENFAEDDSNDYRNPNLAEALKVLGFVQKFGVGIQLARSELRRAGLPKLEFQVKSHRIKAIVRRST